MAAIYPTGSKHGYSPLTERREPGKIPAAALALIVHAAFFAVIVLGVSWQIKPTPPAIAELWDRLPPMRNVQEPPPEPAPEPKIEPPPVVKPVVEQPSKTDIELKAKKEKADKEKAEQEKREKQKKAEEEKKKKEEEAKKRAVDERVRAEQAARDAATAAIATARNAAIQDYAAKISALIRNRANIPDTVTGKPALTVRLRLLVNGAVFDAQVIKPSGNRVYDEAVERAINGIQNWPLPQSADLFGGRRELNLNIEHER